MEEMQLRIFLLKGQETKSACCQAKYPRRHLQKLDRNLKQSQKHAKLYASIRGVMFLVCLDHVWIVKHASARQHSCSRSRNERWNVKNTLIRSHHGLQASFRSISLQTAKPPVNGEEGPEHNRCCLISKIIERQGWIP